MNFNNNKAIYEQIADRLCDEIIAGQYKSDGRIPSVREYAVTLEVNTNTAVKAYELLAREEIIYNKRGLGYFVAPEAPKQIAIQRKKEFLQTMLPEVFRQMELLSIDIGEVIQQWEAKKQLNEVEP
ncbi:MAG: GntR family transcriptional regulator [Prevotella sp.]|nr:GntR family transcriptional regulator [Prevotella sp.]MDD7273722.1 GntR family transcriptional regulator [Prevotellaceae bacterium]MDY3936296.1 GntR family transcriptional regulator [Prevotella sp.]MDY4217638.1 GntR family transcriptional regulator [Prevotella sp.]